MAGLHFAGLNDILQHRSNLPNLRTFTFLWTPSAALSLAYRAPLRGYAVRCLRWLSRLCRNLQRCRSDRTVKAPRNVAGREVPGHHPITHVSPARHERFAVTPYGPRARTALQGTSIACTPQRSSEHLALRRMLPFLSHPPTDYYSYTFRSHVASLESRLSEFEAR